MQAINIQYRYITTSLNIGAYGRQIQVSLPDLQGAVDMSTWNVKSAEEVTQSH